MLLDPKAPTPSKPHYLGVALLAFALSSAVPAFAAGTTETQQDRLDLHGDFRLRYEHNSSRGLEPSWSRGVLRGRLGATYRLNDRFEIGGRVVTGDPDNPRTTDITLSDFSSDFELSLDQAYATYRNGDLMLTAGKFAKPFASTELVWDGDVNPQGIGGRYGFEFSDSLSTQLSAVYFLIDDNLATGDSSMRGAQLSATWNPAADWQLDLHVAYFDYELGPLLPNVAVLARGNNVGPDNISLLSDFDLFDIIGAISYSGFGDRWPVRFMGNFVRNHGAAVPEDTGYGFDLFVGHLEQSGHFQIQYGYMQAEKDAILGLFSHDNIVYPTNYKLHTLTINYKLMKRTFIGLTHYRFRRLDPDLESLFGGGSGSRTRLNLFFSF